jgi:antitoxin component of MazEF toxin-antitoxin module
MLFIITFKRWKIMQIPIITIGNSKGIRIPQAVLKQVGFGDDVELLVTEGKITLRRSSSPRLVRDFSAIADFDDNTVQRVLLKITGTDLIIALVGAEDTIKEAIYRNLSEPVRNFVKPKVEKLEHGDARDLIIERSRCIINEAIIDILKE